MPGSMRTLPARATAPTLSTLEGMETWGFQSAYIKDIGFLIFKSPSVCSTVKRVAGPACHIVQKPPGWLHVSCLCPHFKPPCCRAPHAPSHIQLFHMGAGELDSLLYTAPSAFIFPMIYKYVLWKHMASRHAFRGCIRMILAP